MGVISLKAIDGILPLGKVPEMALFLNNKIRLCAPMNSPSDPIKTRFYWTNMANEQATSLTVITFLA